MPIDGDSCYVALRKMSETLRKRVSLIKVVEICQCIVWRCELIYFCEPNICSKNSRTPRYSVSDSSLFRKYEKAITCIFNYSNQLNMKKERKRRKERGNDRKTAKQRCVGDRNPFEWFTRPLQEHDGVNLSHEKRQMFYSHKTSLKRQSFSVASTYSVAFCTGILLAKEEKWIS